MEEIKSCPFCGSTASVESQFGKEWWVQCDNIMNCGSSEGGSTPDEAVQRWNRRAVPQANTEQPSVEKLSMSMVASVDYLKGWNDCVDAIRASRK